MHLFVVPESYTKTILGPRWYRKYTRTWYWTTRKITHFVCHCHLHLDRIIPKKYRNRHNLQTLKSYHIISLMLIMSKPSCISSKKIVFYYHSSFKDGGTWMGLILLQSQSRYINFSIFELQVRKHWLSAGEWLYRRRFRGDRYLLFYIPLKKWRRDVTGLQDIQRAFAILSVLY